MQLRNQFRTLPDGDVVLDMSGVRLLGASGLRAVLDLRECRARAGAQLVLAAPAAPVCRVLCQTASTRPCR